mgnify:CR=1 FL=1
MSAELKKTYSLSNSSIARQFELSYTTLMRWKRRLCAGLPAIESLLGEGINVNVTLLFSGRRYARVVEAYLRADVLPQTVLDALPDEQRLRLPMRYCISRRICAPMNATGYLPIAGYRSSWRYRKPSSRYRPYYAFAIAWIYQ